MRRGSWAATGCDKPRFKRGPIETNFVEEVPLFVRTGDKPRFKRGPIETSDAGPLINATLPRDKPRFKRGPIETRDAGPLITATLPRDKPRFKRGPIETTYTRRRINRLNAATSRALSAAPLKLVFHDKPSQVNWKRQAAL